jgi:hypothetical protein
MVTNINASPAEPRMNVALTPSCLEDWQIGPYSFTAISDGDEIEVTTWKDGWDLIRRKYPLNTSLETMKRDAANYVMFNLKEWLRKAIQLGATP